MSSSQGTEIKRPGAAFTPPPATTPMPAPVAPPRPAPKPAGLGLPAKIFLATAGIVTLVLGGTLALITPSAKRAADAAVDRGLVATREQVQAVLGGRERALLNAGRVFVQNPNFRALFAPEAIGFPKQDQAEEAATVAGATWAQLTDAEGVRLAKSDNPSAPPDTLSGSALIGNALEGREVSSFGIQGDSTIIQTAAVPIRDPALTNAPVMGVLMLARTLDRALADSLRSATSSEVVFYTLDTAGTPHVAVSSITRTTDLDVYLKQRVDAMRGDSSRTTDGKAVALSSADSIASAHAEVLIGDTHYLGQGAPLLGAAGQALGGFVALRSRDAELAGFYQLRRTILLSGAIGLVLSFLLSYAIARQITKPVGALVAATRRAAEGDYTADITVRSRDEIGTLADAFRAMLNDLRDKQALVEFLSVPGTEGRTVPLRMGATAMHQAQQQMGGAMIEPGQTFANRYDVKDVLGVGGMGMVFKANDRQLDEIVAIKTLKPDLMEKEPAALERFKDEIRLARRISHRNVVRNYDLGEFGGVYYITMEYVEGKSLKDLIRTRGRLPVPAVLTIGKQLCRALEVAHEQGVIHRDIKPQNMVVAPDGVLKVMDFGIARLAERTSGNTQAGMVIGTPEYMAPEQLLGDNIDGRVDLYAAGVVLYECLTGKLPIIADSPIVLVTKILEEKPTPPRDVAPDVPQALSDLVLRAMAKNASDRPAGAAELHDLLAAIG